MRSFLCILALATAAPAADSISWAFVPQASAPALPTWEVLFDQAIREGKPLCIWVGYKCKSTADQIDDMVHFHAGDTWRDVKGPGVVVLVPNGSRDSMRRAGVVAAADVCATNLRAVLAPRATAAPATSWGQTSFQPNFAAPPRRGGGGSWGTGRGG